MDTLINIKDKILDFYNKVKFIAIVFFLIGMIIGIWTHKTFYSDIRLNEAKVLKGIVIDNTAYELVQKP
jgi:hypothetical protein